MVLGHWAFTAFTLIALLGSLLVRAEDTVQVHSQDKLTPISSVVWRRDFKVDTGVCREKLAAKGSGFKCDVNLLSQTNEAFEALDEASSDPEAEELSQTNPSTFSQREISAWHHPASENVSYFVKALHCRVEVLAVSSGYRIVVQSSDANTDSLKSTAAPVAAIKKEDALACLSQLKTELESRDIVYLFATAPNPPQSLVKNAKRLGSPTIVRRTVRVEPQDLERKGRIGAVSSSTRYSLSLENLRGFDNQIFGTVKKGGAVLTWPKIEEKLGKDCELTASLFGNTGFLTADYHQPSQKAFEKCRDLVVRRLAKGGLTVEMALVPEAP